MSSAALTRFRLVSPSGSYASRACRFALSGLFSACARPLSPELQGMTAEWKILRQAQDLLLAWRRRVDLLGNHGVEAFLGKRGVYAKNCAPVGVMTAQTALKRCNARAVCPWCWAHYRVREPFYRCERLLYPDPSRAVCDQFSLVLVQTERFYPAGADGWMPSDLFRGWISRHKGDYYREYFTDAVGGTTLCSIEPPSAIDQRCWRVYHRVLAVVPADSTRDYWVNPELGPEEERNGAYAHRYLHRFDSPRRSDLVRAVGLFGDYPSGMMFGDPGYVSEICQACCATSVSDGSKKYRIGGARLSAVYGQLRGQLEFPIEDHDMEANDGSEETGSVTKGASVYSRPQRENVECAGR